MLVIFGAKIRQLPDTIGILARITEMCHSAYSLRGTIARNFVNPDITKKATETEVSMTILIQ